MYLYLKVIHITCAIVTISGFLLRGYWMMLSSEMLMHKATRVAPHIVDTIFLLSGIAMLYMAALNPFSEAWLAAKFAGLIVYIVLGTIAIRRGPTARVRLLAFIGAVAVFAYIAGVALARSPASWLAWLSTQTH